MALRRGPGHIIFIHSSPRPAEWGTDEEDPPPQEILRLAYAEDHVDTAAALGARLADQAPRERGRSPGRRVVDALGAVEPDFRQDPGVGGTPERGASGGDWGGHGGVLAEDAEG